MPEHFTPANMSFEAAFRGEPNQHLQSWLADVFSLCDPERIILCTGEPAQQQELLDCGVLDGVFIPLNQQKLPGCYLHRSHPNDVARTEQCTYICAPHKDFAGPTNNWMASRQAYGLLRGLFAHSMRGRTCYIIPFLLGPVGCPLTRVGIEVTDSLYVAASMSIMTRVGLPALEVLGDSDDFTRCLHSIGDCDPQRRYICHFPLDNTIWSFGSGYGGNALLGKKCMALRMAGYMGLQQGWMAEHMLITGVQHNEQKSYVAAAFPSACGKTNFAMLIPPESYKRRGWRVTTVGDDIAWLWVDHRDGRLRGINPEAGYFGVLPGTNWQTNPNAMSTMAHDTIFTNTALLPDGDVWWEGKTLEPPPHAIDWTGQPWTPDCGRKAAHPNSRFTAPMKNNPALDEAAMDPAGVPISAIIFGGRRSSTIPLVYQAFNWIHGVYVGATLGSETTAASTGKTGVVRRDPMAMLPFMGYSISDYLIHWFRMRRKMADCPRIFHVNWFRKNNRGEYLWPGYGENIRILEWILNRCQGKASAVESLLGWMPRIQDINLSGIEVKPADLAEAQRVDSEAFKAELLAGEELFLKMAGELPKEMIFQRELLISRL
ncbi:MAG: phosphoenolpyruvate carboxykinase (GTP) [Phycisphaerales bacterium]|nr:phosphoenolpyruvate carboxykinase (GTP) [Phycisphaerales bacterium]